MSAVSDLEFLRKIQRLLAEGEFVATYKFALLQSLADLSVERALSPGRDNGLSLRLADIAEKFIEYYSSNRFIFRKFFSLKKVLVVRAFTT